MAEYGRIWQNMVQQKLTLRKRLLLLMLSKPNLVVLSCCKGGKKLGRKWVPVEALKHTNIETWNKFPLSRDPIASNNMKMGNNSNYIK